MAVLFVQNFLFAQFLYQYQVGITIQYVHL